MVDEIDYVLMDLWTKMVNSPCRVWLSDSLLFLYQETNHAELMEHEASLSRSAQEEKLSLQHVIKAITQALVSVLYLDSAPFPVSSLLP